MSLRFHWRLVQAGHLATALVGPDRVAPTAGLPDLDAQADFCRQAERCGIESLLVDINAGKPDPMTLALALARETDRIAFMVAARPGLMSPTLFVQQVNTFAALADGRITLNVVAGHSPDEQRAYGDHLDHDDRYARLDEWLAICRAFWRREGPVNYVGRFHRIEEGRLNTPFVSPHHRTRPEIYLGGNSPQARESAVRNADCWLRFADAPGRIREQAEPLRRAGIDIGLRLSIACRASREEALRAASALLGDDVARPRADAEGRFVRRSDAASMREAHALGEREWLTPWLWTGAVRTLGATSIFLLGTPDEVAAGLLEFQAAGVSQFILSGWPTGEELHRFGSDVLPLVRRGEGSGEGQSPPHSCQGSGSG